MLMREAVHRFDCARRTGKRRLGVTVLVADEVRLGGQAFLLRGRDIRALHPRIWTEGPFDRQSVERGFGAPPGVGDDGDGGVADRRCLLDARHLLDLGEVKALHLAAEHRAVLTAAFSMPGSFMAIE